MYTSDRVAVSALKKKKKGKKELKKKKPSNIQYAAGIL